MRSAFEYDLIRTASRIAIVALIGSAAAACSSDTARLSNSPFSDGFKTAEADRDPVATGSIDQPPAISPLPRSAIRSEPLPAVAAAPHSAAPVLASAQARTAGGGPGWSTAGGTAVTLGSGDTLNSISNRYGVPPAAILSANGMTAGQVGPGRRVVIPVYSATGEGAHASAGAPPAGAGRVVASSPIAVKRAPPATLADASAHRRPGQPLGAAPAPIKSLPVRQAEAQPSRTLAGHPVGSPKGVPVAAAAKALPAPDKVAKAEPLPVKAKPIELPPAAKAVPAPVEPPKTAAREPDNTGTLSSAAPAADAGPGFRWPARGRVIAGFGGGSSNEGINIAVPDGTPVKAAGDGVVAYAGSEVKGYGNLVLIRHENGYVSAYAHNGDVEVKRGQKVTRGQTIAKSGQTGNVTSPQLHFEIRKGSSPVDPMKYLANAT